MSLGNAALTPRQRLSIAQLIIDEGWTVAAAADYFRVGWPTAQKWARRYVELGDAGMADRSSRPHSHPYLVKKIVHLRIRKRFGPVQIAGRLEMSRSTVHAVLTHCHLNRLTHVDVKTGEPARRYEHDHPVSLIHVDVKKLGNIPNGGGWRFVGKQQGARNRQSTPGLARNTRRHEILGYAFIHTVIDDHSRVAYAEIHDDERAETAIGVLRRAVSWFADHGVRVERVLSDNGSAYRSHAWKRACADLGIAPKFTRPRRPQTNAKIGRFHRTLADGWAYVKHYNSESARRAALPQWLHFYNHHRPHTAIGKLPPITRLSSNLPGHYN